MATKQDKQYISKSRIVPGTQEEATALNNGGAMFAEPSLFTRPITQAPPTQSSVHKYLTVKNH